MRRVYQIPGLAFLAFSAYLVFESRQMEYYADLGPGPGFFPFWLGVLLAVLSLVWLVQVSVAPARPVDAGVFPDRWGTLRVVAIKRAMGNDELQKKMEASGLELRYMDAAQLSAYWDQVDATLKPIIEEAKAK
jgi:hypothetical protein